MTLLIVDDERIAIEAITANMDFGKLGIEHVLTANSMTQAQELFRENHIEIVLCDIEMPNGNGLELIEWINVFDPSVISLILSCHMEFPFAQQAVSLSCMEYILKPVTPVELTKSLKRAVQLANRQASDGNLRRLGKESVQSLAGTSETDVDAVEQVRRYIVEHVQEDLIVEKLANMVHLSQNHLTRCFKKKYGQTVTEYITEYRMKLAEELLRSTNLTVTMVSTKIGYANYAYFTKQFKRYSGDTPTTYRAKRKTDG